MSNKGIKLTTESEIQKFTPGSIRRDASNLLNLGFLLSYEGPSEEHPQLHGKLKARKGEMLLRVTISWAISGRATVCLYQIESVAGNPPSPTRRKRKTFWKVARSAAG